ADQWLVLGVTTQQITMLSSLPKQEAAALTSDAQGLPSTNNKFTDWLKASIEKRTPPVSQD
ncbi:MAG: flagellar biosynthetic protein FliO, partial [Burkholderiales bacterium]|nr:flagellar biosynthetic protein FliO [Burkholderiales bacterium]